MNAINTIASNWRNGISEKNGGDGAIDDAFSKLLNASKEKGKSNGIESALAKLSERFPDVKIKAGEAGSGIEGLKKLYEKDSGDQVTVSPDLLSGLFGNNRLAKQLEDAISGFMNAGNNLMNVNAGHVQRTVTITYTEIRYGEFHRDENSGDILAAADLTTDFNKRFSDMIKKFFGIEDAASEESGESDAAAGADETAKSSKGMSFAQASMMSSFTIQFYISQTMISGLGQNAGGQGGSQYQQLQQFAFGASYSSNSLASHLGDYATGSATNGKGGNNFGISGMNGSYMANYMSSSFFASGFSADNLRMGPDGLFFNLKDGKSLLAQMLESLRGSQETKEAEIVEPAVEDSATVEENAVAAV